MGVRVDVQSGSGNLHLGAILEVFGGFWRFSEVLIILRESPGLLTSFLVMFDGFHIFLFFFRKKNLKKTIKNIKILQNPPKSPSQLL